MIGSSPNNLTVDLEFNADSGNRSLDGFRAKLENTDKAINNLGSGSSVLKQFGSQISAVTKQTENLSKSFSLVAAQRLDNGKVGELTRSIVAASERSRQLHADIASIQRELAKPQKNSSMLSLVAELEVAQREADQLQRKLNNLDRNGAPGANPRKLSNFQKTNLGYQVNDVLTMAAMGADPMQILASQAGQIIQIFDPAQIAAFAAKYASLVTVLGAGTLAIAATWKITSEIRKEAERRLKYEEQIQTAINKQIIGQREGLATMRALEAESKRKDLNAFLGKDTIQDLDAKIATLRRLGALIPAVENGAENPNFTRNREQLSSLLDERRDLLTAQREAQDNTFRQNAENRQKAQEAAAAAARKRAEDTAKKVEKINSKLLEMQESASSTLEQIAAKAGADNPFVRVFSEAGKALDHLRENTKGLSADLVNTFETMQKQQNSLELFSARLENRLKSAELRRDAQNFRNPADPKGAAERQQKTFETITRSGYEWNKNPAAVIERENTLRRLKAGEITQEEADQIKAQRDQDIYQFSIYDSFSKLSGSKNSTFNAVNQQAAISFLASQALKAQNSSENKSFTDKLREQINIADSSGARTPQERALIDRKIIDLTRGADPSMLPADLRERAAGAREREASRTDNQEKEANEKRDKQIEILIQNQQDLIKLATNGDLESVLKIVVEDPSKAKASIMPRRSSQEDVKRLFQ